MCSWEGSGLTHSPLNLPFLTFAGARGEQELSASPLRALAEVLRRQHLHPTRVWTDLWLQQRRLLLLQASLPPRLPGTTLSSPLAADLQNIIQINLP